jgi:pyrophosphatase PpaX
MIHKTLKCVIFDIDGTLTRTNELIFSSFNYVATKYLGRTFSEKEIIGLFGPPEEGALAKIFGPALLDDVMKDLLVYYREHHDRMASLHQGIDGLLAYLKERKVKLAVFTGKGRHTTEITLHALRIRDYFEFVVSGNDVVNHKPHGEGIMRILHYFNLPKDQALMVGDSMADVKAARAAGVPMAAVLWDSFDASRVMNAGTDLTFVSVDDMDQWCRKHLKTVTSRRTTRAAAMGKVH